MTFRYATTNLIDLSTLLSVTSEDTLYIKENLYNERPSFPFRFTAKTGNQILVDLGAPTLITLAGIYNHNLLAPTKYKVKAAAANPPGGGNWDIPDYSADMPLVSGLNNSYLTLSETYRYWLFDFDDATSPTNTEIGEAVLATHSNFGSNFRILAESDGVVIRVATHVTHYGHPHDAKRSHQKKWNLNVFETTAKGSLDALEAFLVDLEGSAGRFIMIEDDNYEPSYYVRMGGSEFIGAHRFSPQEDRRDWSWPILEFPKGIILT